MATEGSTGWVGLGGLIKYRDCRCWTQWHGWSTTWDPWTTSPMCLSVFTGYASHSGLNTKSSCWRTKLYMGARRDTWVLWYRSPIYQAVGHCVLPTPVACRCLLSDSPPSIAGLSRLPVHESGTLCHRRRRQPSRCICSISVWSLNSSDNRIQTSSSNVFTVRLLMLTV